MSGPGLGPRARSWAESVDARSDARWVNLAANARPFTPSTPLGRRGSVNARTTSTSPSNRNKLGAAGDAAEEDLRSLGVVVSHETKDRSSMTLKERYVRYYQSRSLFCLKHKNKFRKALVYLTESSVFGFISLLVIIINSIFLALYDPTSPDDEGQNAWLNDSEIYFTVIFGMELVLRVMAQGLILHPHAFLRSAWNWLDFIIVIAGILEQSGVGVSNVSSLRAFRVLRPLRTIKGVKGMRVLVNALMLAVPYLMNVFLLWGFAIFIFAMAGLTLWSGVLRRQCVYENTDVLVYEPDMMMVPGANMSALYLHSFETSDVLDGPRCSNHSTGRLCGVAETCIDSGFNINYGFTSFDNVAVSSLTVFQVLTLEGWSKVMESIQDAFSVYAFIYFVLLIVLGSFFMLQLALGVIYAKYQAEQERQRRLAREKTIQSLQRGGTAALFGGKKPLRAGLKRSGVHSPDQGGGGGGGGAQNSPSTPLQGILRNAGKSNNNHSNDSGPDTPPPPPPALTTAVTALPFLAPKSSAVAQLAQPEAQPAKSTRGGVVGGHGVGSLDRLQKEPSQTDAIINSLRDHSLSHSHQLAGPHAAFHATSTKTTTSTTTTIAAAAATATATSFSQTDTIIHTLRAEMIEAHHRYYAVNPLPPLVPVRKKGSKLPPVILAWDKYGRLRNARRAPLPGKSRPGQTHAFGKGPRITVPGVIDVPGPGDPTLPKNHQETIDDGGFAHASTVRAVLKVSPHMVDARCGINMPHLSDHDRDVQNQKAAEYRAKMAAVPKGSSHPHKEASRYPRGQRPPEEKWRDPFFKITMHPKFTLFIFTIIIINTVFLALEHHNMNPDMRKVLRTGNVVFTCIFIFELLAKVTALGPNQYKMDYYNIFDAAIVAASIIEFFVLGGGVLTVFRALRVLRVFRVIHQSHSLQKVLTVIASSLAIVSNALLVLVLFMFIYAILGMQLFGGDLRQGDTNITPRANFDNFLWSLVTVFQILSGENWDEVMHNCMKDTHWAACLYFLSLVVIGSYIFINLFLAILLEGFQQQNEDQEVKAAALAAFTNAMSGGKGKGGLAAAFTRPKSSANASSSPVARIIGASTPKSSTATTTTSSSSPAGSDTSKGSAAQTNSGSSLVVPANNGGTGTGGGAVGPARGRGPSVAMRMMAAARKAEKTDLVKETTIEGPVIVAGQKVDPVTGLPVAMKPPPLVLEGKALYMLGPDSPIRLQLRSVISHPVFEYTILFCILVSSVLLALEYPAMDEDSDLALALFIFDIVFAVIFSIEAALKILTLGFLFTGKNSYLRNPWNALDFFVVLISILSLVIGGDVKFLRALRALRPLRIVARSPTMKIVLFALLRALAPLAYVLAICLLLWIVFGVLAVQLFGGRLYYCKDVLNPVTQLPVQTRDDCPPGQWVNQEFHFDHIGASMLTLFEVGTLEGWNRIMYHAVDAVGVDQQPQRDNNPWAALFFLVYIFVTAFFMMNLFIVVVVDNFTVMQSEATGNAFLNPRQREWVMAQRAMLRHTPQQQASEPPGKYRRYAFRIVISKAFEVFIIVVILVNIVFMASRYDGQTQSHEDVLRVANVAFTVVYILEALLKLTGLGPVHYFRFSWNRFDFLIVLVSIVDLVFSVGLGATIARIFRVLRVFKLIRRARGLRILMRTLVYSLPSIFNVGTLMILVLFIYAVAGVSLFGDLDRGTGLDRHNNFENFGSSALLLFKVMTGDRWATVMRACSSVPGYFLFFLSFMIIAFYIIVNLFVALMLENFKELTASSNQVVTGDDFDQFREVWAKYDTNATAFIPITKLILVLRQVPPPLGLGAQASRREIIKRIARLELPDYRGYVHFRDVVVALARRKYRVRLPPQHVPQSLRNKWQSKFRNLRRLPQTKHTTAQTYAALYIQSVWRGKQQRKHALERLERKRKRDTRGSDMTAAERARVIYRHIAGLVGTEEEVAVAQEMIELDRVAQEQRALRSQRKRLPPIAGAPRTPSRTVLARDSDAPSEAEKKKNKKPSTPRKAKALANPLTQAIMMPVYVADKEDRVIKKMVNDRTKSIERQRSRRSMMMSQSFSSWGSPHQEPLHAPPVPMDLEREEMIREHDSGGIRPYPHRESPRNRRDRFDLDDSLSAYADPAPAPGFGGQT